MDVCACLIALAAPACLIYSMRELLHIVGNENKKICTSRRLEQAC